MQVSVRDLSRSVIVPGIRYSHRYELQIAVTNPSLSNQGVGKYTHCACRSLQDRHHKATAVVKMHVQAGDT